MCFLYFSKYSFITVSKPKRLFKCICINIDCYMFYYRAILTGCHVNILKYFISYYSSSLLYLSHNMLNRAIVRKHKDFTITSSTHVMYLLILWMILRKKLLHAFQTSTDRVTEQ